MRYFVRKNHKRYEIQDLIKLVNLTFHQEEDQVITHHKKESSPSSKHVHLVTQWYHEENIDRRKELVTVLHMNLLNEEISKIYFLQPKNRETLEGCSNCCTVSIEYTTTESGCLLYE